jgi:hypothetical protein
MTQRDISCLKSSGRSSPTLSEIRGLLGENGDSPAWLSATSTFPNQIPRFSTAQECINFTTSYIQTHGGSNPDYPHLQHIFTTLISWKQIQEILLPEIEKARNEVARSDSIPPGCSFEGSVKSNNLYEQPETIPVVQGVCQRLDLPIYKDITPQSVLNTMQYLYYHMRCGIYVMICNGKVRIFCPFVNRNYKNTWSAQLQIDHDGDLIKYYGEKEKLYRKEEIMHNKSRWWANGNIICNEPIEAGQQWGDSFLASLLDMLREVCHERTIPDCEFFVNKRDHPQIKFNSTRNIPVEPYGFLWNKDDMDANQDVDLPAHHSFASLAPVMSFYTGDRFADLPWPTTEDWELATGCIFPPTFLHSKGKNEPVRLRDIPCDSITTENIEKYDCDWNDKVETAFFRGSATGGGTTMENNQRLKLAYLSHEWKDDSVKGGLHPYLDAALTSVSIDTASALF